MDQARVSGRSPKSLLRVNFLLLLGLGLGILTIFAVHTTVPTSGPTSVLAPDEAQAAPSRHDIKYRHYTVRGTVYTRWGYHRATQGKGFGYRHIIGGDHGWYPERITKTLNRGKRAKQYEYFSTHRARVLWFKVPGGSFRYRVIYSISREDTPSGGRKGVITAFVDERRRNPNNPCSVPSEEQYVEASC